MEAVSTVYGAGVEWSVPGTARIPIEVRTANPLIDDKPVEVDLDLAALGIDASTPCVLRVVEVNWDGTPIADTILSQFDRDEGGEAGKGTLTFWMESKGRRAVGHFHAYVGATEMSAAAPLVTIEEVEQYEGQDSYHILTQNARYYYHKNGGGFASIIDISDKKDWVGYHPGGESAGEYRGVPNIGHCFHPGYPNPSPGLGSQSRIVHSGPVKTRIESISDDGLNACYWDIFPKYARMTLTRVSQNYWFLYEGTPVGRMKTDADYHVVSDGLKRLNSAEWHGLLPDPRWIYFGTEDSQTYLYFVMHDESDGSDQYWPMRGEMTVFGFGRQYRCCEKYLSKTPARFTLGFGENSQFDAASHLIEGAWRDLDVNVGEPEFISLNA